METRRQLSVIMPVYNERKTLVKALKRVLKRKEVYEIIIIDDCSTDGCIDLIKSLLRPNIRIIRHQENMGRGTGIVSGLKVAKGKWVIIQDADLEQNPKDYAKLMKPLLKGEADFVIGNRWWKNTGFFWPRLGNKLLTFIVNFLFGSKVGDLYCGYKMGPTKLWKSLRIKPSWFESEPEIIAKLGMRKARIAEVNIDYTPRTYEEGKKIVAKDVTRAMRKIIYLWFVGKVLQSNRI